MNIILFFISETLCLVWDFNCNSLFCKRNFLTDWVDRIRKPGGQCNVRVEPCYYHFVQLHWIKIDTVDIDHRNISEKGEWVLEKAAFNRFFIKNLNIFQIRAIFIALAFSLMGITLFILGRMFLFIYVPSTIDGCLTIVGFLCVVNAAFGYYFIPRTQGKSHQEIMGILKK